MLVTRIARRLHRQDEGVAIIAVVGVMAVGVLLSALILSSVVGGMSFTSATRAGVQSQASAEAGVAAAQAGLNIPGDCAAKGGVYAGTVNGQAYSATVWVKNAANSWARGCPVGGSAQVRIIATGLASDAGVAGNGSGDDSFVEAIFNVNPAVASAQPSPAAVYVGGGTSVNSLTVTTGGQPGDIHILKGDFSCTSGTTINGSVVVADGNANLTNSCTITGSVKASKGVTLTAAVTILGDVIAAGGDFKMTNPTIKIGGNVFVSGKADDALQGSIGGNLTVLGALKTNANFSAGGNVLANGQLIDIRGKIGGTLTSKSTAQTEVMPDTRITGAIKVGGEFKINGRNAGADSTSRVVSLGIAPSVATFQSGLPTAAAPTPPTVVPWVDFEYKPAEWSNTHQLKTWSTTWKDLYGGTQTNGCSVQKDYWNGETANTSFTDLAKYTTPTVVDARACNTLSITNLNVGIKTDIVFIGKSFQFGNMNFYSLDGNKHEVSFLIPDGNPTQAGAQCTNGAGDFNTYGSPWANPPVVMEIKAPLTALVYTPCKIALNNGVKWRGQFYSGSFGVSAMDSLVYMPIGIPTTDLSGGGGGGGSSTGASLGDLAVIRNRTDNGETS